MSAVFNKIHVIFFFFFKLRKCLSWNTEEQLKTIAANNLLLKKTSLMLGFGFKQSLQILQYM